MSTPADWKDGEDVIIAPAIPDDQAKEKFPKGFVTVRPYLRLTPQPNKYVGAHMPTAVIVDALRTAGGKRNGRLSGWHPADLAGVVLRALVERNDLDPALVDDVIMGCVMQVGAQALNVGRNAVLAAGFPESVPATTIDRQCGSSQQAAHFAAQGVMAGVYDVVIAAGVEVMSLVPMGATTMAPNTGRPFGPMVKERYVATGGSGPSGDLGRADRRQVGACPRAELDAFGAAARTLALQATEQGRFDREILPVPVRARDKETGTVVAPGDLLTRDEGIRPGTTVETLADLKPAFKPDGKVTAGNSSQITDGASACLIMSEDKAAALGLTPRARFHTFALAGVDPLIMLTGPIPATHKVLRALRPRHRRHRSGRDQRGVRLRRPGLGARAASRHGEGQRQRGRHRPRAPARLLRHQAAGHPAVRAGADRRPLRAADHVRGRRYGQRHDHRASVAAGAARGLTLGVSCRFSSCSSVWPPSS